MVLKTNADSKSDLAFGLHVVVIQLESPESFVPTIVNMDGTQRLAGVAAKQTMPQSSHQEPDAVTLYRPELQFPGFADWVGSVRPISMG